MGLLCWKESANQNSDMGYVHVTAMKSASEFSKALELFSKEVGVPEAIIEDLHKWNKSK